jgi:hypothetical protein
MARRRRYRNARRVVVVNPRRRRRRTSYRRRRYHHNPRRRRYYRHNASRRHYRHNRRHYRRNVARAGGIQLTRPMSWLPVLLTGGAAATVSSIAPTMILGAGATANQVYLVQAGIAAAGLVLLPMLGLRGAHPIAWLVGASAPIVAHFITDKVVGWLGLGWYPYQALQQSPFYPPRLYGADMYPYEGGQTMWEYGPQERVGAPEAPFEHMYNT